ncbi:uncharacterized protein TrAFT101_002210 [Trichoderma asperellum]|uniref:uncharacterized protein n=1 Tax=Trichoderma asperellum TaxID=101201 RepID=UPI003325C3EE|nr:hypothetical protein TrAFT101_002210 [Trichoderma asperellum]
MQSGSHAIGARPNGRPTQFQVNHESRKPLFSSSTARPDDNNENGLHVYTARTPAFGRAGASGTAGGVDNKKARPSSENLANASVVSSGGTRIPRMNSLPQTRRKPISLREAMEMAEGEEEAAKLMSEAGLDNPVPVDGSPSPAPRPWRTRTASEVSELRRIQGEDHLDTKARSKIPSVRNPSFSATLVGGKEAAVGASPARATLLSGGNGLARQRSNEFANPALRNALRLGPRATSTIGGDSNGLPDLVPGIEDPLSSIDPALSAATLVQESSPDKSFAWQMDEDFTAGELQISDSPRVRVGVRPFASRLGYRDGEKQDFDNLPRISNPGSRNTKLDEIRSLELKANGSQIPFASSARPRPANTKLDDIRTREGQVERQIPLPSRHLDTLKNTRLEEIRQREADGVSRRAFAAARLQEIKEQNAMARPRSPDEDFKSRAAFGLARRRLAKPDAADEAKKEELPPSRIGGGFGFGGIGGNGKTVSDTPATAFKRDPRRAEGDTAAKLDSEEQRKDSAIKPKLFDRKYDDRDLLRRLARAASSPTAETESRAKQLPTAAPADEEDKQTATKSIADRIASRLFASKRASSLPTPETKAATDGSAKDSEKPKPTVGFAGLQRTRSIESIKSKRSSMQSEPDPTDRIEAEMKLFAPSDNHSERGSLRAPSPPFDDESDEGNVRIKDEPEAEATPKPSKPDPLSMPTPRVTGAYVETPVTVKTEKAVLKSEDIKSSAEPFFPDRKLTFSSWRNRDQDAASDPGTTDDGDSVISKSAVVRKRRAKSLPQRRLPIKNSVKLPSVKDDMMELRRAYNIDDSTFDDLDEILSGRSLARAAKDLKSGSFGRSSAVDLDLDLDSEFDSADLIKREGKKDGKSSNSDGEIAAYERMNKTLQTGLLRIRSAKQGIERIEDRFSRAQPFSQGKKNMTKAPEGHEHHGHLSPQAGCPYCTSPSGATTVTYLHLALPRLYHQDPTFRLTWLGLLVFILSTWYAAESAMCAMYCRPTTCPASKSPCVWSFDDPTDFGTAIPIKLDQWITGGGGRQVASVVYEEAYDWIADIQDLALGRDIEDVDMETLSPEQKRRHRRRLRKKGLLAAREPRPEDQAKWDEWRAARLAKERGEEVRPQVYSKSTAAPTEDEESGWVKVKRSWGK